MRRAKSWKHAWNMHKWEWLAASVIATGAAVATEGVLSPKEVQMYGYVFTADHQPLADGLLGNSVGPMLPIDQHGRFLPLQSWPSSSKVVVFGPPDSSGHRQMLGEYTLARRAHDWDVIRLSQLSTQVR